MKKTLTVTLLLAIALAIIGFVLALATISCDDKTDTHTHEWEWVVTTPATLTADGLETETCKTCGVTRGTRPIDKLPEEPEYRTDTVTFAFIDMAGDPVAETKKATVKGTMLLADWNNAKTAIKTRIESTQNTATGFPRGRFLVVFADDQNTAIIFDLNAGNGKYEVKDGEFRNLYINPSALNSITNEEIINAVTAMNAQEPAKE